MGDGARGALRGRRICLGLTPTAARWLDDKLPALEELTGHPVRSQYKLPWEPDAWPPADVAVLAPATFNTINQWALGITEKFIWDSWPRPSARASRPWPCRASTLPMSSTPSSTPALPRSTPWGVRVLYGEGGFVPNKPGQGRPENYPWHLALEAAASAASGRDPGGA